MLAKLLPWRKRRAVVAAVPTNSPADEALEGALEQLWLHVAVPKAEFHLTYAPAIRAAMAAVEDDSQRKALYRRIKFALLASNGVIFGRTQGLDVEDSMVMSQVFAFATTVAIALETYVAADRENEVGEWQPGWELFKAQDVLSKEGWEWLTQYPPVFNDWLAYFLAPERSEIKKLLEMRPRKFVAKDAPAQDGGASFLLWLKHQLANKEMSANAPKANIHVLDGDRVFLAIPGALQHYADTNQTTIVALKSKVKRLRIHETREDGSDLFGAKIDGKKKEGMIIYAANLLFDSLPTESECIVVNDIGNT